MRLHKLNRILHRDLGYFFFGMTIIYAVSGIALNHRHQWNPNYIITGEEFTTDLQISPPQAGREQALEILNELGIDAD